jgi:hypothetical protein
MTLDWDSICWTLRGYFIFAGEVPPNKMYELLTTWWGVGHNLAVALIDLYGVIFMTYLVN